MGTLVFVFMGPGGSLPAAQLSGSHGQQQVVSASITGSVLRADTGRPLPKASVTLSRQGGEREDLAVRADSDGAFRFPEVRPGRYRLRAQRTGFVTETYGQRGGGPGIILTVESGQHVEGIEFRLKRAGVISGTVIDEDNEPVEGLSVRAERVRFARGGRQQVVTARSSTTDDLGNFRLYGLSPGYYYVVAGGREPGSVFVGGRILAYGYRSAYYPGSPARESASRVYVAAGAEAYRTDIPVQAGEVYTIRGTIVDAEPTSRRKSYAVGFASGRSIATQGLDRQDGNFSLRGIDPGAYTLVAAVSSEGGATRRGYRTVSVVDADVDVAIEIGRSAEVRGEAQAEGKEKFSFAGLHVVLESEADHGVSASGPLDDTGSFRVQEIPEGNYRFELSGRENEVYLKAIRCGGKDYSTGMISLGADEVVDDCEAVLRRDLATLNAFVSDGDKPAQGMVVVAIPQLPELRRRARHTITAQTDVNGFAELRGLIPGEYFLFAVRPSDDAPYYDLEFPERNRETAVALTAAPKEKHSTSLKVAEAK